MTLLDVVIGTPTAFVLMVGTYLLAARGASHVHLVEPSGRCGVCGLVPEDGAS
ncbi:hypothetical protein [Janibacter sp. GS2]|uniref:hypothetical protein n=1 Tax=Janibacter sp. GS2 TaxID=3442646 RepID=UPI003EBAE0E0